ncbi:MAG: DNA-directed RNA polymerase subunit alpha C-terminal domain-containing protein, partial [Burkholderiaceae bacterium]
GAVRNRTKRLHYVLLERITLEADEIAQTDSYDEESLHMRQLLKTKLVDMDFSVRALNCLKAAQSRYIRRLSLF